MLLKPILTPSGKRIFTLNPGQVFMAVAMISLVIFSIMVSFSEAENQNSAREAVLAEESDSSALIFTQRESFGLILQLRAYQSGVASLGDLLLARSTLAQRLNVITSTGESTYEVAGQRFRDALGVIDGFLLDNASRLDEKSLDAAIESFLTENRALTAAFQDISRTKVKKIYEERTRLDLFQGALSSSAFFLGSLLFLWLLRDLRRGFRIASQELREQSEAIGVAERDFLAIEMLDKRIEQWNGKVAAGDNLDHVIEEIKRELAALSGANGLVIGANGEFDFAIDAGSDSQATETRQLLARRLQELIAQIQIQGQAKKQLAFEREHCGLTDLLNRRGLRRELVRKAEPGSKQILMLVDIDLDGFTALNNAIGQQAGDKLLIEFARRLENLPVADFSAGRIAADEFGLILTLNANDATAELSMIREAANFTSDLVPDEIAVTSAVGWHIVESGETADQAAAKAAAALRAAKSAGKSGSVVEFEDVLHGYLLTEYLEQIAFRNALLAGEVVPFLQPIVNLQTRVVEGYESLARWKTPDRGTLRPAEFLPIASQGDLLDELFEVVLEALGQSWPKFAVNKSDFYVSVNVDPKTLEVTDFAERLHEELARHEIDPHSIVIEITEQSLVDPARIAELEKVRLQGIRIALDDFGTGYSSLAQLAALPIDILKVDRSFVVEGTADAAGEMLRTILQMASTANLKVIVEGIETEELAQALLHMGFESGQGYLFGKPSDLLSGLE